MLLGPFLLLLEPIPLENGVPFLSERGPRVRRLWADGSSMVHEPSTECVGMAQGVVPASFLGPFLLLSGLVPLAFWGNSSCFGAHSSCFQVRSACPPSSKSKRNGFRSHLLPLKKAWASQQSAPRNCIQDLWAAQSSKCALAQAIRRGVWDVFGGPLCLPWPRERSPP